MRIAAILKDNVVINMAVIGKGVDGDSWLDSFDGSTTIPDPDDTYGEDFLTVPDCSVMEVTHVQPMVQIGWVYVDGAFSSPAE